MRHSNTPLQILNLLMYVAPKETIGKVTQFIKVELGLYSFFF